MDPKESQERLLDYLYGEMSPLDRHSFKKELEENPDDKGDLVNFLQLRQMVTEHLPNQKAPKHLTKKLFAELGIRRPWYEFFTTGFIRPALTGAMVVALTLGVAYQVSRYQDHKEVVVKRDLPAPTLARINPTLRKYDNMFLANRAPVQPILRVPVRRVSPGFQSYQPRSLVSLAGLGQSANLGPQASVGIPEPEIEKLEIQAQQAVGQFMHRQAIRMRAMGEFKAAADHLGHLIKTYPFYPLKLEAMAQRIDCLFKAGEGELARAEIKILKNLSPNLAFLMERRWGQ